MKAKNNYNFKNNVLISILAVTLCLGSVLFLCSKIANAGGRSGTTDKTNNVPGGTCYNVCSTWGVSWRIYKARSNDFTISESNWNKKTRIRGCKENGGYVVIYAWNHLNTSYYGDKNKHHYGIISYNNNVISNSYDHVLSGDRYINDNEMSKALDKEDVTSLLDKHIIEPRGAGKYATNKSTALSWGAARDLFTAMKDWCNLKENKGKCDLKTTVFKDTSWFCFNPDSIDGGFTATSKVDKTTIQLDKNHTTANVVFTHTIKGSDNEIKKYGVENVTWTVKNTTNPSYIQTSDPMKETFNYEKGQESKIVEKPSTLTLPEGKSSMRYCQNITVDPHTVKFKNQKEQSRTGTVASKAACVTVTRCNGPCEEDSGGTGEVVFTGESISSQELLNPDLTATGTKDFNAFSYKNSDKSAGAKTMYFLVNKDESIGDTLKQINTLADNNMTVSFNSDGYNHEYRDTQHRYEGNGYATDRRAAEYVASQSQKNKALNEMRSKKKVMSGGGPIEGLNYVPDNQDIGTKLCVAKFIGSFSRDGYRMGNWCDHSHPEDCSWTDEETGEYHPCTYDVCDLDHDYYIEQYKYAYDFSEVKCYAIAKKPHLDITRTGIFSNASITTSVTNKVVGVGFGGSGSKSIFGSWDQYLVVGGDDRYSSIEGLASGTGFADYSGNYTNLTIANKDNTSGKSGISMDAAIGRFINYLIIQKDKGSIDAYSTTYTITSSSYIGSDESNTIHIVNNGDINISENVEYLDNVWLVATDGDINTCSSYTENTLSENDCTSPLTINGFVYAKSINFMRTAGAEPSQSKESNYRNSSEKITLPVDFYKDCYKILRDNSDSNQAKTVYLQELAPRE